MHVVLLLHFSTLISLIALGQLLSVFVNKAKFAGMLGLLAIIAFCGVGVSFHPLLCSTFVLPLFMILF